MTFTESQQRRYNSDARPFRIIGRLLILCGFLSWFNLDPLDGLHTLLPLEVFRILVLLLSCVFVNSIFKSTVRRIIQEESTQENTERER